MSSRVKLAIFIASGLMRLAEVGNVGLKMFLEQPLYPIPHI